MSYSKILKSISKEDLGKAVKKSKSYSATLKAIGIDSRNGRYLNILKDKVEQFDIDTSHFGRLPIYDLKEVLIENSTYNNQTLKKRLIDEGILSYICIKCGNTGWWNNKPLVLQLDHINGKNNDNRLENLRFLCPNCHSQTETFGGRNINL